MRKLLLLCAVFLLFVFPVVANATSISVNSLFWDDSRSTTTSNGVTATDGWSGDDLDGDGTPDNNGFKISWDISNDGSLYTYEYTVSGVGNNYLSFGLSHLNVEVTDPSVPDDFDMTIAGAVNRVTNESVDPSEITYQFLTESTNIPFEGPKTFEPGGGSNPTMPANIYAIKWEMDGRGGVFPEAGDIVEYSITFTSEREPVWGNFYAKDGSHNRIVAEAWNTGFLETPTETSDFIHWIARPDSGGGGGGGGGIPEPATILLLGSGLLGLAVSGKKRFKKRNG